MSFFGNINSLYVYCDLLEAIIVGDTKVPLLCIVDKPKRIHRNVHSVWNPILYVPLQKKHFDTVEINIMTDTGLPYHSYLERVSLFWNFVALSIRTCRIKDAC